MQVHSSFGSTANGSSSLAQAAAAADMDVAMHSAGKLAQLPAHVAPARAAPQPAPRRAASNSASGTTTTHLAAGGAGAGSVASQPSSALRPLHGTAAAAAAAAASSREAWQHADEAFTPEMRASLAQRGLRLLAFACDAGWPCTTRMLLDLLTNVPLVPPPHLAAVPLSLLTSSQLVPLSPRAVVASALPGGDGLTPLHRATRSGSAATVREILNFARGVPLLLNPAARGAARSSALHLAAEAPEGGPAAVALLQSARDAPVQWFVARDAAGDTPAVLAARGGCRHINELARMMVQQLAGEQRDAAARGGGSVRRGGHHHLAAVF